MRRHLRGDHHSLILSNTPRLQWDSTVHSLQDDGLVFSLQVYRF